MSDVDNSVRSFGMSGFIICDELRQIEQRFGIELGHVSKAEVGSAVAYYPQFEQSVRLEAAKMSENYEVFYCLEQAIRKLIVETLEDAEGIDWWSSTRIASAETPCRSSARLASREKSMKPRTKASVSSRLSAPRPGSTASSSATPR